MKKPRRRTPSHKVNHKQKALAIKALTSIVQSDAQPYVKAKAAAALLNGGREPDDVLPGVDPSAPTTVIFLPKKDLLPGQREDETAQTFKDRTRAEGRRACYCASLGEPYDAKRPLPFWPWPVPGSDAALEDAADHMADAAEAAWLTAAKPTPREAEVLGPRADSNTVIYSTDTAEDRANFERWKAEAVAAGHAILAPQ
jgi:hypothetical protein